jgi:hypothetical protein
MKDADRGPLDALFDAAPPSLERCLRDVSEAWARARLDHRPLALGCACGAPVPHVTAADFELDLLDYVEARSVARGAGDLFGSLQRRGIPALLEQLALAPPSDAMEIVADLRRSIASFGRRGGQAKGAQT